MAALVRSLKTKRFEIAIRRRVHLRIGRFDVGYKTLHAECKPILHNLLADAQVEERNMLWRLARDERLDDETDGTLQRLMRKEIIECDDGLCRFQVPVMKRYVASRIEIESQGSSV